MLKHPLPCIGWLLLEPAPRRHVLIEKALKLGLKPGPLLGKLKKVRNFYVFLMSNADNVFIMS